MEELIKRAKEFQQSYQDVFSPSCAGSKILPSHEVNKPPVDTNEYIDQNFTKKSQWNPVME